MGEVFEILLCSMPILECHESIGDKDVYSISNKSDNI